MNISIDTLKQILKIDGVTYSYKADNKNLTVADWFERYEGVKEYDGVVAKIQKWFYGSLQKTAWCATSMSYALSQLGIMQYTIGTKEQNCYNFYNKVLDKNTVTILNKNSDFKRGDILILCFDSVFNVNSRKHITSVYANTESDSQYISCIGGNQSDMIRVTSYARNNIVFAFRPNYDLANDKFAEDM